jgi:two-component system sensor kinase FixL
VFGGTAVKLEDQLWTITRNDHPEDIHFTSSYTPIRDKDGSVVAELITSFDTTKRANAEAARLASDKRVRASEARLKAAVDLVGLALYAWDPTTGNHEWDYRLRAMWGVAPDAQIDEKLFMAGVHLQDRDRVTEAIARAVDPDGDGIYHIEYRVIGINNGVERWVSTYGQTVFEDRKPVWFIGAALDVTAQKHAQEELGRLNLELGRRVAERERSEDLLRTLQGEMFHAARLSAAGQMAAAMAHELIQPLSAIRISIGASTRLLAKVGGDFQLMRDAFDDAAGQIARAGKLVRRMRDFVGRGEAHKRLADVVTLIGDAQSLALLNSNSSGVEVECRLDPAASRVFVDPIQIEQVLVNLIRNAVEAMPTSRPRKLTLTTMLVDARTVAIAIGDSGPGLPPEVRDRVFEPFVSTKADGMGLGLWLCRSIVEAHGGRIACDSRMGEGTLCFFTLPTNTT